MRQLRHCFGVLLLVRVGKMARESLLVAALVLCLLLRLLLLLLLLVRELVLLLMLLAGAGVEDGLAVLLMLQFGRNLTLGRDVASVLAVSDILSRVGRRFRVRRRDRPDGGVLDVLLILRVQVLVRILNHVRVAEISYTLQGGRLCWRALVLPVELLLLVERDLGDAGADGRRVRRREAHALGIPAGWA
jgi:hypothetical protein